MNEEILRIMKMVEEGKITAEKGQELIEALNEEPLSLEKKNLNFEEKFLRVKVDSVKGDRVRVQLPIKVIKEIIKVAGKLPISTEDMKGVDMDALMTTISSCLDNEIMGEIVDVVSAEGDIVKVVIE